MHRRMPAPKNKGNFNQNIIQLESTAGKKEKKRKKLNWKLLIIGIIGVYLLTNIIQMHATIWQMDKKIEETREEKQEMLAHQEELEQRIKKTENGEYIEKLAREQLGLVKPGEKLIIPKKTGGSLEGTSN